MFRRFYAAQEAPHTMTAISVVLPPLALNPATLAAMQRATVDALPPPPGASEAEKAAQREGALAFLAALLPRNPVEATLAAGIVVAHYAAMECFRRAARGDLSVDLHLRTMGKAIALCRMIDRGMRDLARRQGSLGVQPAARPASVRSASVQPVPELGARAQSAPEAARASTPPQPPVAEGRHERRRRERAERHLAAAAQRAGLGSGAADNAMQQRLVAEVAARAAASTVAAAA
jgi:hypothetical protein